jgi:hypothetical protein
MALEKRKLSARFALEWAFGIEKAQLELPDLSDVEERGFGFGTEYVLMQRMRLGNVKIDVSKGRSSPHDDADIIAALVSSLPDRVGGRQAAIQLSQYARAMSVPDAGAGLVPKLQPKAWRAPNKWGRMAKTEVIRTGYMTIQTPHPKNPALPIRRRVKYKDEICPCYWDPHPDEIRSMRREYKRWWNALNYIRSQMMFSVVLDAIEITSAMPPSHPWRRNPRPSQRVEHPSPATQSPER